MIKSDVIDNPASCFNTAYDQEQLFVLLARDPAAPVAIRAWIAERLRLGRNKPGDEQIREAYECATLMELQRTEITSVRGQQELPWTADRGGSMLFPISRLDSILDLSPHHETMSWQDLTALLSEPRRSPCTRQTCTRAYCPDKRGACWSPATFTQDYSPRAAETLSLLVFDIDQLTDDQIDEIRGRIGALQYLMHSTHSDVSGSRCLRIVISLSRSVSAGMWRPFFHTALQSLVPGANPSGVDAGRIYFLPSCPRDAIYFTQVNEGLPLDVDALLTTIPSSSMSRAAAP